jgi:hypothetical protein
MMSQYRNFMKNTGITAIAGAIAAVCLLPGIANASFVLDTGTPIINTSTAELSVTSAFFDAAEFAITAGQTVTSLSVYLNDTGADNTGATFTLAIYPLTSIPGAARNRTGAGAAVDTVTASYGGSGWNTFATSWTPTTSGDYWLSVEVDSGNTAKGLELPEETTATLATGTVAAINYATASSGVYTESGALPFGAQITAVPLPTPIWLLGSAVLGLGGMARRRRPGISPGA